MEGVFPHEYIYVTEGRVYTIEILNQILWNSMKRDERHALLKWFLVTEALDIQGPFEKFVDWRQYAAVLQREAVTFMTSCSGESNVVVAWSSYL
jgi:hypothetical protein